LDPARHAEDLFTAYATDKTGRMWTYLPYGPFTSAAAYRDWVKQVAGHQDPLFFAVVHAAGDSAVGVLALQRIDVAPAVPRSPMSRSARRFRGSPLRPRPSSW